MSKQARFVTLPVASRGDTAGTSPRSHESLHRTNDDAHPPAA
jgi:hypothetical protein